MRVDAGSIRRERCRDRRQRGQRFPSYGKGCKVPGFDGLCFAHHRGYSFAAEAGFDFGKYGLFGKRGNHAIPVLARYVLGGQYLHDSRVRGHERVEIAETKPGARVRTADCPYQQRSGWNFVGAEDFCTLHLAVAIETDESLPNSVSSLRCRLLGRAGASIEHGGNDFAITGAAAEHAADRVHDVDFTGRGITLE